LPALPTTGFRRYRLETVSTAPWLVAEPALFVATAVYVPAWEGLTALMAYDEFVAAAIGVPFLYH
jgi:hypothetical protein